MNFLKKISAFLPWIAYSLFKAFLPGYALGSAILISLLSFKKLFRGFVLEWGNLIIFLSAFISSVFFNRFWISENLSLIMSIFFFLVVTISLLSNKPFTAQYAKLQVDEKFWNSPLFMRVNRIMTLVLGIIFLIVSFINIYRHFHPNIINDWIVWAAALTIKCAFIKYFPGWYKKRCRLKYLKQREF